MYNKVLAACVIALGVLFSLDARSQSLVVQPRITAGLEDYSLTFGDVTAGTGNAILFRDGLRVSDQLKFSGAGVTTSYGRAFLDLSAQTTNTGSTGARHLHARARQPGLRQQSAQHRPQHRPESWPVLEWQFCLAAPRAGAAVLYHRHRSFRISVQLQPDAAGRLRGDHQPPAAGSALSIRWPG